MDLETEQLKIDGERAARLRVNEDFVWAKTRITSILSAYDSLSSLPSSFTPEQKLSEIEKRQAVIGIINAWFEEIEGFENSNDLTESKLITRI